MRYYYGPRTENFKGVLCLTFDVEYAYTKGTQAWGALPRWLGLETLLSGGLSVESGLISAFLIATTAAGMDVHNHTLPQLLLSISGIVGPITWYLGFMPPKAYLEFIRRRARRAEA